MKSIWLSLFIIALALRITVMAEDGYRLWLRYDPLPKEVVEVYRPRATAIVAPGGSATLEAVRIELANGCAGLLGGSIPLAEKVERDGA
ncbi:MAG TPA: alpha-glucuronidase family glycosyl hydrolase, partial [Blastocatellia bacterium]|nr:alpha-glucuronidase family glycosyl hydrolase [Blastocatellia bacterium]